MPAALLTGPPGIRCVFSDGSTARFELGGLPCAGLVDDLLTGLAQSIHPHGTVDAAGSVNHYVQSIRDIARKLDQRGFAGRAADLRRTMLAQYWMASTGTRESCTRRLLLGFTASGGHLDAQVAELAAGRAYNVQLNHHQLPPYLENEWEALTAACRRAVDESFASHKRALAAAERGRDPAGGEWNGQNLRWLLTRTGPVGLTALGRHLCQRLIGDPGDPELAALGHSRRDRKRDRRLGRPGRQRRDLIGQQVGELLQPQPRRQRELPDRCVACQLTAPEPPVGAAVRGQAPQPVQEQPDEVRLQVLD